MKKAIASAMLLLFLFNLGGYYMVFSVLQLRAENQLSHSLESNDLAGKEKIGRAHV